MCVFVCKAIGFLSPYITPHPALSLLPILPPSLPYLSLSFLTSFSLIVPLLRSLFPFLYHLWLSLPFSSFPPVSLSLLSVNLLLDSYLLSLSSLLSSDYIIEEKNAMLQKKENEGFGFVLRGAKGREHIHEFGFLPSDKHVRRGSS